MSRITAIAVTLLLAASAPLAQEVIIDNLDASFSSDLGGGEGGVVVMMYHGLDAEHGYDPADFEAHMQYLADNGYDTWTMGQLQSWIETGSPAPVNPTVVLTFDDNYLSIYTVAYPTLLNHGFVGTNFTHTQYVGLLTSYDHADWSEIQAMESANTIFTESHSVSHPNLPTLGDSALAAELGNSRSAIETNIAGKTCRHLAYPYGAYDSRVMTAATAAGYETAVTTVSGVTTRSTPLLEIPRYAVNPSTSLLAFAGIAGNAVSGGGGEWTHSASEPELWGTDYQYAPAATPGAVATWLFTPPSTGEWEVSVWYTDHSNRATNALYTVNHQGGAAEHRVDQTTGGGQWNVIGTHQFSSSAYYSTTLSAADANGFVIADAMRFRQVSTVPVGLVLLGPE